ncbi:MAG: glycosyltransferase [Oscillospiraceae bacterium]|nr:glycosyltransferase [Oscillospiraceae bacterium]
MDEQTLWGDKYDLSIVIPTRNRNRYASFAVTQAFLASDIHTQIVVQDNSDTCELAKMLPTDTRIKYSYSDEELSFSENFNRAIELCDGEYICLIGDDDGILPWIIDIVQWMKRERIEALYSSVYAGYVWPAEESEPCSISGSLSLLFEKVKLVKHDCNNEILKLMRKGGLEYLSSGLPRLYHGVIKRECMEAVRRITGKYFGGLSPDIYIASALSTVIKAGYEITLPLTIAGVCPQSGTAASVKGKHTGQLSEAPHFRGIPKYNWAEKVPAFFSVECIWADSAIHALIDLGCKDILSCFNTAAIDSYCYYKYSQFKELVFAHMRENGVTLNSIRFNRVRFMLYKYIPIIIRKLTYSKGLMYRANNIQDIFQAQAATEQIYLKQGVKIDRVLADLAVSI